MSLGAATSNNLNEVSIYSKKKMKSKKEYHMIIVKIFTKLKESSPLKYSVVCNISSLPPVNMVKIKEECILKFYALVDALYKKKKLTARSA